MFGYYNGSIQWSREEQKAVARHRRTTENRGGGNRKLTNNGFANGEEERSAEYVAEESTAEELWVNGEVEIGEEQRREME